MNSELHSRLFRLWDGRAQYVINDGIHYEVLTPNGKDEPLFVAMGSVTGGYSELSTGFPQAPEPGTKPAKRASPGRSRARKNTDVKA